MIRALIAQTRAVLKSPGVRIALAGMALKFGVDIIVNVVDELRDEMTAVQAQLAEMRADASLAAMADAYPTDEDLDPLGRGTDSPIGDGLAEELAGYER